MEEADTMPITAEADKPVAQTLEKLEAPSFQRVLKNRNFLLLWLAQLISLTSLNAANFGLIVLVNDITHSVLMAGLAIITFTLPAVPFTAIGGVIVDRLNKRLILWVSNLLRTVTMLLMFASLLIDHSNLAPLFVLALITSVVGQFFTPAEGASIPLLVGERELMPALSLFNITLIFSQAIGFLVLGRVVATIFPPFSLQFGSITLNVHSTDMLFVVIAFFYLVCTVLILCIPARVFHERHLEKSVDDVKATADKAWKALWTELADGWRIVRSNRLLYFSVVQLSIVGIVMLTIGELAGQFVQQILHRPAEDMSIVFAPAAVGLIGASVLMPPIARRVGKMRLTAIGFHILAVGFLLLAVSQWVASSVGPMHGVTAVVMLWMTVLVLFLLGVAMACVNVPTQTIMQEQAPESGRGRVLSLQFMMFNGGSIPVLLFAGVVAQFLGINQFLVLAAASLLLFCWWGMRYVRKAVKC